MARPPATRTPFGRLLLVQRVTDLGCPVAAAAEAIGVSRATAYRRLRRYRSEGPAGLEDRSSRPHRSPHTLGARTVRRIPSHRSGQARTDRAFASTQAGAFADAVQLLGARHKLTRPPGLRPTARRSAAAGS